MTNPVDIQDRLQAQMTNFHVPEGVSVAAPTNMSPAEVVAQAQREYPDRVFLGNVLHFEPDGVAPGMDEWVFEVRP